MCSSVGQRPAYDLQPPLEPLVFIPRHAVVVQPLDAFADDDFVLTFDASLLKMTGHDGTLIAASMVSPGARPALERRCRSLFS